MFKHISFCDSTLTKTISVKDEVYRKLLKIKREDESFSDLFERISEGVNPLDTLKRLRGCVEFKDKEKMLAKIYEARSELRV